MCVCSCCNCNWLIQWTVRVRTLPKCLAFYSSSFLLASSKTQSQGPMKSEKGKEKVTRLKKFHFQLTLSLSLSLSLSFTHSHPHPCKDHALCTREWSICITSQRDEMSEWWGQFKDSAKQEQGYYEKWFKKNTQSHTLATESEIRS